MRIAILSTLTLLTLPFLSLAGSSGCTNPSQRKEWRAFSRQEKKDWADAFKCLNNLPRDGALSPSVFPDDIPPLNTSGSYYDDVVYLHMDLNHHIHFTGLFFPWHRWYVSKFQVALEHKCGYKGVAPYWDWTLDAPNFYDSPFWKDADPESGIGGWGNPSDDFTITDGAFASLNLAYPTPHHLRRNFSAQPFNDYPEFQPEPEKLAASAFTKEEVDKVVNGFVGDFKGMQAYVEGFEGMHAAVHNILLGDLKGTCPQTDYARSLYPDCKNGPKWSPNDPLFWMHHAMIDKVWYDWQHRHEENFRLFNGGSVQMLQNASALQEYPNGAPPAVELDLMMPTDGLWEGMRVQDVLDTKGGNGMCYEYI